MSTNQRRIWYALVGVVGAALLMIAGLSWVAMEGFAACRNVVLNTIPSPDKTRSIVIFRKECNATVADSFHASVVSGGKPFSAASDAPFLSLAGTSEILASWRGNNAVEIAVIPGGVRELKRELHVGDVQIDYK